MRAAVEAGRVRVLAVTAPQRQALLPEVPTTNEAGAPGFEAGSWHMMVAPRGTPQPALDRLERALGEALAEPALIQAMAQQGVAARFRNQRDATAFHRAERERWERGIREANITAD
jgi:tripartite-type tricarboxylate transporter receptor subunit TctC